MNDMHRAVHLESGKIIEVSSHIAKQKDLMLSYGYMLQEMPPKDEDLESSDELTVSEIKHLIESGITYDEKGNKEVFELKETVNKKQIKK